MYQIAPHSISGVSLSKLLMGHRLRKSSRPDVEKQYMRLNENKLYRDDLKQLHVFSWGDKVSIKNFRSPRWSEGTLVSEMTYVVKFESECIGTLIMFGNEIIRFT